VRNQGVGRWTAEVALMRGLGRPDVFPAGDFGLQVAGAVIMGYDRTTSEKDLRKLQNAGWGGKAMPHFTCG